MSLASIAYTSPMPAPSTAIASTISSPVLCATQSMSAAMPISRRPAKVSERAPTRGSIAPPIGPTTSIVMVAGSR